MVKKSKRPAVALGLSRVLVNLTQNVSVLTPSAVALFNSLYVGKIKFEKVHDVIGGNSIKSILESNNDPLKRACDLVDLVDKVVNGVKKSYETFEEFERSEDARSKLINFCEDRLKLCLDASLLLKEALDNNIFPMEEKVKIVKIPKEKRVNGEPKEREEIRKKKMLEQKMAEGMVKFFLGWNLDDVVLDKLPQFNLNEPLKNIGLFQQLVGGIPVSPIADSIMPFKLLDWQKKMFMALRSGQNVVVSAPTSSGKTMVALGYIVAFLQNELKSLLVYVVPNNVLALEVSAILNRYQEGRVSTILDMDSDRRQDERVIVCTPSGAINSGFIDTILPEKALFVVDEVHAIANSGGAEMEKCLREFSGVQTLLLSATMTNETVERLAECLCNNRDTIKINERTQFMVSQDMVPRVIDGEFRLIPMNPIGAVSIDELRDINLDLSLTPRDVLSLFVRMVKVLGVDNVPEYLAPIRFFCLHQRKVPEIIKSLGEVMGEEEEEEGIIRRLTMEDIMIWQKLIMNFLVNPGKKFEMSGRDKMVEKIISSYRMSLTDEMTIEFSPETAFKVVEELRDKDMFPALFFFPDLFGAVNMASYLVRFLLKKNVKGREKKDEKQKKSRVKTLEKQISSLERVKGNGREIRERRRNLRDDLDREFYSEMIAVPEEQCLNMEGGIPPETFNELVTILKRWNKNFTQSHSLAQMVLHGIGVLSGDMPLELQVYIRQLFSIGTISLLLTTSDCAYGINTPTKTVILADGLNEANRRQMKGRAGRKGLGYKAFSVSFRCSVEEARQHLKSLDGESITVYNCEDNMSDWITNVKNKEIEGELNKEFYKKSYLMFGKGAIIGPVILEEALVGTEGNSNRPIRILLSLLPCIPQNSPDKRKEEWEFNLPVKVLEVYERYGMKVYPNAIVYDWMMNQMDGIDEKQREELVGNAKRWLYFIYLLKDVFRDNLYEILRELITDRIIATSVLLE